MTHYISLHTKLLATNQFPINKLFTLDAVGVKNGQPCEVSVCHAIVDLCDAALDDELGTLSAWRVRDVQRSAMT